MSAKDYILNRIKNTESINTSVVNSSSHSAANYIIKKIKGVDTIEKVSSWLDKSNRLINDSNTRYSDNSSYRNTDDVNNYYKNVSTQKKRLVNEAKELKYSLLKNSDKYDKDWLNSVIQNIDNSIGSQSQVEEKALKDRDFWSQFENEDAYKAQKAQAEDITHWNTLPLETVTAERDAAKTNYKSYSDKINDLTIELSKLYDYTEYTGGLTNDEVQKYNDEKDALERQIADLKSEKEELGKKSATLDTYIENRGLEEDVKVYDDIVNNDDYAPSEQTVGQGLSADAQKQSTNIFDYIFSPDGDDNYKYINSSEEEKKEIRDNNGITEHNILTFFDDEYDYSTLDKMTNEEKDKYNYLYYSEGKDSADKYLDKLTRILTIRETESVLDYINNYTDEHKITANIATFPLNMVSGTLALTGTLTDIISGKDIDPYSSSQITSRIVDTIRNKTTNDIINSAENNTVGKTAAFLYNTGMSIGDSIIGAATIGKGYIYVMGMNAASSEARRITENGGTQNQALLGGLASGAAEAFFERYSLDKFFKIKSAKGWKNVLKSIMGQSAIEGSEEVFTDIANTLTNSAIMGYSSDYNKAVYNYELQGMSREDAKKKAVYDNINNTVMSGAGGFLSGAVMGGVGVTIANANNKLNINSANNTKYTELGDYIKTNSNINTLTELASTINDSNVQKLSKSITKSGDNSSSLNVGKLQSAVVAAIQNKFSSVGTKAELSSAYEEMAAKVQGDTVLSNMLDSAYAEAYKTLGTKEDSAGKESGTNIINNDYEVAPSGTASFNAAVNSVPAKTVDTGEEINIKSVDSINGGNVKVVLDNGKIESIDNIDITDNASNALYSGVSQYLTSDTANAYINGYADNKDISANIYKKGFYEYYRAGVTGQSLSSVKSMYGSMINENTKSLAYNLGRTDSTIKATVTEKQKAAEKRAAETLKTENASAKKYGGVIKEYSEQKLNNFQRSQLRVLDIYGKAKGIKIHVVDDIKSQVKDKNGRTLKVNGKYVKGDNAVVISLKADKNLYLKTAGHELFHFSEEFAPEETKALQNFVIDRLKSDSEFDFDSEVARYGKLYNTTDTDIIYSEMAADSCFDVLSNDITWGNLIKQNDTLANKLLKWFKQFIADLRSYIKKQFGNSTGTLATALNKDADALNKIADMWSSAIDKASVNAKSNTAENNTDSEKYSKKMGGYFPDINISVKDAEVFGIKDYRDIKTVKEKVYTKLLGKYISSSEISKPITNIDTGMKIFVYKGGINEMFGNAKNYKNLNYNEKIIKVATMESLAKLIKYGEVRANEAGNYHNPNSDAIYAYLTAPVTIDGKAYNVNMDIKKTIDGNRFYIHAIKIADGAPKSNISSTKYKTPSADTNISQDNKGVNTILPDKLNNDTQKEKLSISEEKDSEGNELTEAQAEFFKDSKVRDENGNLLVVYHGTTNKEFNVFDITKGRRMVLGNGFYFSTNKNKVSELYSGGDNGRVIEAYVNLINPYEMNKSNMPSLNAMPYVIAEKFNVDVPTIDNVSNILIDNGYDGIIYNSGGYNVIVAFHSNQIKYNDNLNPTSNTDMRYSLSETTPDEIKSVSKENEHLKQIISNLKNEFRLTEGIKLNRNSINSLAKNILSEYSSKYKLDELTKNLTDIFEYISNNNANELDSGDIMATMTDIAKMVISQSETVDKTTYEEYSDLRKYIRNTVINVSDNMEKDLSYKYDSYNNFRKSVFGKIKLSRTSGIPLDTFYNELSEMYPELFDIDTPELEQLESISKVYDDIKEVYIYNPYKNSPYEGVSVENAAYELASEIYEKYFDIPEVMSFADKKHAELIKAKTKAGMKLSELKNAQKSELQNLKKQFRDKEAEFRAKRDEREAKIRQGYRESARAKIESRQKTELKNNIKKISKDFSGKLINESEKNHIPEELKIPILRVLRMLDFSTIRTTTELQASFDKLQIAYNKLSEDSELKDSMMGGFYDKDIETEIEEISSFVGNKRLDNLDNSELIRIKNLLNVLNTIVINTNKAFALNQKKAISELGNESIGGLNELKKYQQLSITKGKLNPLRYLDELLTKGMITPYYFFKQMDNTPLWKLFNNLYDGENKYTISRDNAEKYARKVFDKYNFYDWNIKEKHNVELSNGDTVKLTLNEMMSLYATYKRESLTDSHHLEKGGFFLKNDDSNMEATPFKAEDYESISQILTEEQKRFVDNMVNYLSTVCADLGNEVSMKLFGIKKYKESYYFPFSVNSGAIQSNPGETRDIQAKNKSFTKRRVTKASAPLNIGDFVTEWSKHAEDMAMHNAFVLPLEDIKRVWNYKSSPNVTVKYALKRAFGDKANSYIYNFLNDLNGGSIVPVGEGWFDFAISRIKKVAVLANPSVAIQQPTTIARAMAVIDAKYLIPKNVEQINFNKQYEEAKKYAPVYTIKEWGYFDTNMSKGLEKRLLQKDYKGIEKVKGFFTDSEYRSDAYSWLAQKGDAVAWGQLWYAAKNETKELNPNIEVGSKEFYDIASNRVTEIIRATQVYDSVFKRSEIMRSKSAAMKMATAFMSEPTTNYNMLLDAYNTAKEGGKTNLLKSGRIIGSVAASTILNILLKSLIYAMRDREDEKKDKDGNIIGERSYMDKYIDSILSNAADEPTSFLPFIKDIISVFEGKSVIRTDLQMFLNVYYAIQKLDNDKYTPLEKISAVGGAVAGLFGEPVTNITRDIESIYYTFIGNKTTDNSASFNYYNLYKYTVNGDKNKYTKLYNQLVNSGKSKTVIETGLRKALKNNDKRIAEAAKARKGGDSAKYQRIVKEIVSVGFSQDTVVGAVNSAINELEKSENTNTEETTKADSNSETTSSVYAYSDIIVNLKNNDTAEAQMVINDIYTNKYNDYLSQGIKAKEAAIKSKSGIKSAITSEYKSLYQNANTKEKLAISKMLQNLRVNKEVLYTSKDIIEWNK